MGFALYQNYLPHPEGVIAIVDSHPWDTTLKRRTQQYGHHYDFMRKSCTATTPIPESLQLTFTGEPWGNVTFTQCIVNEYVGKQGIAAHVDAPCFGNIIAILSLGDACSMKFRSLKSKETQNVILPHNSLLVMSDTERYEWTHEITGQTFLRRISLTYRTMV